MHDVYGGIDNTHTSNINAYKHTLLRTYVRTSLGDVTQQSAVHVIKWTIINTRTIPNLDVEFGQQ